MAVKNDFFKSKILYYLSFVFFIFILTNIQSHFLAPMGSSWIHIDFVSLIIIFLSIEKNILFSFSQAIIAGSLLQVYSSAPELFFILYLGSVVFIINIILRFFVIESLLSKIFVFFIALIIKYIIFYLSLNNNYDINVFFLITVFWKEFVITFLLSIFVYKSLSYFDKFFLVPGTIHKR